MAEVKSKFQNTSGGVVGAVVLDHEDKPKGAAIGPKGTIWLSEKEQVLTANAPRNDKDNPFANGDLSLLVRSSEMAAARPIGDLQEPQDAAPEEEPVAPESDSEDEEQVEEEAPPTPQPPPPSEEIGEPDTPPDGFRETERSPQPPPEPPLPSPPAD
jgi:hypothetical protein